MLEFYRGVGQEAPLNFDARKKKTAAGWLGLGGFQLLQLVAELVL